MSQQQRTPQHKTPQQQTAQQNTAGQGTSTIYRIQARGTLDESWSDSVGGMNIVIQQDGDEIITSLTGKLPDQAALSAVLNLLYDLGLTLLSVESLDDPASVEGLVNSS
jgi:hypothetical protein